MLGPNSQLSKLVVMLKACGKTFSITQVPDFTVCTKYTRGYLDHGGQSLYLGNSSDCLGAHRLPLHHR